MAAKDSHGGPLGGDEAGRSVDGGRAHAVGEPGPEAPGKGGQPRLGHHERLLARRRAVREERADHGADRRARRVR